MRSTASSMVTHGGEAALSVTGDSKWASRSSGRRNDLREPMNTRLPAVEHAGEAGAGLGEEIEVIVEELHVVDGFVDGARMRRNGFPAHDAAFVDRTEKVAGAVGWHRIVTPLVWRVHRSGAAPRLPVSCSALEPLPQPGGEPVDGLARVDAIDLRAHHTTADIEIGLCDDRPAHGGVGVFGEADAGVQHRAVGQVEQPADLVAGVFGSAREPAAGRDVDGDRRRGFGCLTHTLVPTAACTPPRES